MRTGWCGTYEIVKAESLAKYRGVIAACLSSRQRWRSLWLSYRLQVYHRQLSAHEFSAFIMENTKMCVHTWSAKDLLGFQKEKLIHN